MKVTLRNSIIAALVLVALAPVRVQGAATVYADDTVSTAAAATVESQIATNDSLASNTVAAAESSHKRKRSSDTDHPQVRIDETGVHVGGSHPVDINVPSFARHRGNNEIDVVGILAIVCFFVAAVAIVSIVSYSRHRRLKMQHETMRAMIEKGMPIPPELLTKPNPDSPTQDRPYHVRNDLRGGLILVGLGAGLMMIAGKVGLILVFIGAARLVVWLIEDRNPKA
jgi:hypothetical protein